MLNNIFLFLILFFFFFKFLLFLIFVWMHFCFLLFFFLSFLSYSLTHSLTYLLTYLLTSFFLLEFLRRRLSPLSSEYTDTIIGKCFLLAITLPYMTAVICRNDWWNTIVLLFLICTQRAHNNESCVNLFPKFYHFSITTNFT